MKIRFAFLFLTILTISVSSMSSDHARHPLLNEEDIELEQNAKEDGPAISSMIGDPNPWESYNQWLCFAGLERAEATVDYPQEHSKETPFLIGEQFGHIYELDLDMQRWHALDQVRHEWDELNLQAQEVCVFAAFLQSLGTDRSLWVINQIKVGNQYWVAYDEETDVARNE